MGVDASASLQSASQQRAINAIENAQITLSRVLSLGGSVTRNNIRNMLQTPDPQIKQPHESPCHRG
jgi:hypothetical protein